MKATDYTSRFRLLFKADENGASANAANFAYIQNGEIVVFGGAGAAYLQVTDMTGRVVYSGDAINRVSTNGFVSGVYVLRLITSDGVKTQKIVIE